MNRPKRSREDIDSTPAAGFGPGAFTVDEKEYIAKELAQYVAEDKVSSTASSGFPRPHLKPSPFHPLPYHFRRD